MTRIAAAPVTKPSDFPRPAKFRDPNTPPFVDEYGICHVFSYTDVQTVLRNAEGRFSQDTSAWIPADHHMSFDFMWAIEPFTHDGGPGRHDALRGVVEPWFRAKALATMEPVVRALAGALVSEVISSGDGTFDLATELAYPLSIRVICQLTGIPLEREQWLRDKLVEVQAVEFANVPRQWDVEAFYWSIVAKRLPHPQDQLLDVLLFAWQRDTISDRELMGYLQGFVQAGTETTGTSLVNAFGLLAEFDLLDRVRSRLDDAEAMRRLVEEILRFGTVFPATVPHLVLKPTSFGEVLVASGDLIQAWLAAANRDPAVNGGVEQSDPATFDPDRWPNRHLALGHGPHYCLGAELARLEIRVLLQEALRRLPGLELDQTKPFNRFAGIVDGVTQAPFRFDQRQAERQ